MVSLWSLVVLVVSYVFVSNAAPLVQEKEKRRVQANQLDVFKLMGQYASAAYCESNYKSPGDQVQCVSGSCPLVETADSATVIEYSR
jgi:hypothetical protein